MQESQTQRIPLFVLFFSLSHLQPILYHQLAFWGENAFRMELYAVDIILLMAQSHDLTFIALCRYLYAFWQVFLRNDPRMIASYGETVGYSVEDSIVMKVRCLRCHTMKDLRKVRQLCAESLAYRLMTETDTEHWLASSVGFDDIKEQSCLAWDAWSWGEYYLIERLKLREFKLIIAIHRNLCAQFLYEMGEIIGEGVVIVYDYYFAHNFSAVCIAFTRAPSLWFTSCNSYSSLLFATMPEPAWNHSSPLREMNVRITIA